MKYLMLVLIIFSGFNAFSATESWICSALGYIDLNPNQTMSVFGEPAATQFEATANALDRCEQQGLKNCRPDSCIRKTIQEK